MYIRDIYSIAEMSKLAVHIHNHHQIQSIKNVKTIFSQKLLSKQSRFHAIISVTTLNESDHKNRKFQLEVRQSQRNVSRIKRSHTKYLVRVAIVYCSLCLTRFVFVLQKKHYIWFVLFFFNSIIGAFLLCPRTVSCVSRPQENFQQMVGSMQSHCRKSGRSTIISC